MKDFVEQPARAASTSILDAVADNELRLKIEVDAIDETC